ncbi:MAG TPA: DUF3459 domain-containing protein, partial [Candidatus Nitrosotenuis sp.]|nr:DUF3459 domain-containing protein [Candidatus Nitrosotenuis sp.]
RGVRRFLIENALHWIQEYHLDGLRLDATWALLDRRRGRHFLAELAEAVEQAGRPALLVAEDHRNLNTLVRPRPGGWGLHGVWADDFHHQMRVHLTREREGYYADFTGRIEDLAETLRGGWFYRGQVSPRSGLPRGTDPLPLPPEAFVVCLQNHDQVGNRALGDRLHHSLPLAAWRAASTLLLSLPYTPLLFMGQEWAASTPFLFFTDHHPRLGPRITAGRRQEFRHFSAFSDPRVRQRIPDPQDPATFVRSRLDWSEADRPPHAGTLRLYRRLLALRRQEMGDQSRGSYSVEVLGPHSLLLWRGGLGVLVHLEGRASLPVAVGEVLLSTEDEEFVPDPRPARVGPRRVEFYRPGALVFRQGARRGGAQG